jgi:hypothetical protein
MPDGSAGGAGEPFWVVDDMYHFDNMAFSRTVGARKFLCCPDCEFGPLGYREITAQQPGAAEPPPGEDGSPPVVCYVAAERVARASAACPARPNKQMDSAALAGLMPQLALPNGAACSRGTPSLDPGAQRHGADAHHACHPLVIRGSRQPTPSTSPSLTAGLDALTRGCIYCIHR